VRSRLAGHPAALVVAFVLVHVWLTIINLWWAPDGMTDVTGVYRRWMVAGFEHGSWVGIDEPWVYPIVALVPMVLAYALAGHEFFPVAWLVLVAVVDLVALVVLMRAGHRRAAWGWTLFLFALGPIAVGRIDAITVPLVIIGLSVLARRPIVAGVLIVVATWIKVWPVAVLASLVIAVRSRVRVIIGAVGASLVIVAVALVLGAGANLASFVTSQTARGLQIEAPVTTAWMWAAALHIGDAKVYFDTDLITFQVWGESVALASSLMNPLLFIAVAATLVLGLVAQRRGAHPIELLIVLSTALIAALIVFNKVGSPQYIAWFAAPLVLALIRRGFTLLVRAVLVIAVLTQLIYPYLYFAVIIPAPAAVLLLTVRNLLLVALFVWAIFGLVTLGHEPREERLRSRGLRRGEEL
jgi:hypothetical protein